MGNGQAKPSAMGQQSGFRLYWVEMQRAPATQLPPYRSQQLSYLKKVFQELDHRHNQSIEVDDFDHFYYLREHPLYERVRVLFREQLEKMKMKRINFNAMLHLLDVFHIETQIESKYRYLFKLYDWDKDFKLSLQDLMQTFEILFYGNMYTEDTYKEMAQHLLSKYGQQGFIKFEGFIAMVPQREVRQLMTLKFLEI